MREILILIFLFLIFFLARYTNSLNEWLSNFSIIAWVPSSFLGSILWYLATCFLISSLLISRCLFNTFLAFNVISATFSSSSWSMLSIMMHYLLWYCCRSSNSWLSNVLTLLVALSSPESLSTFVSNFSIQTSGSWIISSLFVFCFFFELLLGVDAGDWDCAWCCLVLVRVLFPVVFTMVCIERRNFRILQEICC